MANREGKTSSGAVLLLVIGLCGLGGWNYHRNYQAELAERGPNAFSGYDDASLESLRLAYQSELEGLRREHEGSQSSRTSVRKTVGVGDGVEEFERVQRFSQRRREVTTAVASREARVREIEEEQQFRSSAMNAAALHFERLTGIALPF